MLATIGETAVGLGDVHARAADQLDQLDLRYRQARYQIIRATLDSIVRERVLNAEAQKQGKTLEQLVTAEAGGRIEPTEVEVAAWYAANQSRLSGRTLDQLRPQIQELLRQQARAGALQRLQDRLYAERKVVVTMPPFRVDIDNEGAPVTGRPDAPITLVEFSDFQCPFCGRFAPTIKRVEQEFAGQVRVIYRQLPLASLHPNAFKAAEASLCAQEQGKFWEMHDAMFADQSRLAVSDLKATAARIGLDRTRFDGCLDSGRYVERVQNDVKEGTRLGINGTPALFVNGAPVPGGAVPYETVAQAIRDELARLDKR